MNTWLLWIMLVQAGAMWQQLPAAHIHATRAADAPEVVAARKARDRAAVADLQRAVTRALREAEKKQTLAAWLRVAQFEVWLCEAIESHQDNKAFKQAAEAGVAAAEKAVALDPQSSEAHQLLGDLLGQLIPHVFGGGMRYGKRASEELDKAIELNPKNVEAYVSRAINYYYSPEAFGGSKMKAHELLRRAVEIDTRADTPHIWLAQFHLDAKRNQDALREIKLALAANPDRSFTKFVAGQINQALKPGARRGRQ